MAGGVVAGQYAHMELVLKAEDEALELAEVAAGAEGGGHEVCVCEREGCALNMGVTNSE